MIKDLVRFFAPRNVLDPMTGGGTCRDVCEELGIPCQSFDIHTGFDATDGLRYEKLGTFDFIWLHPPYWRMIRYGDDERCLSNAPTLGLFLTQLGAIIGNCRDVLSGDGKLAILIGDYEDRGRQMPLTHLTMQLAVNAGLWPACTDIVRLQYGNTSSRKSYRRSFIPGLHDVCLILRKGGACDPSHVMGMPCGHSADCQGSKGVAQSATDAAKDGSCGSS